MQSQTSAIALSASRTAAGRTVPTSDVYLTVDDVRARYGAGRSTVWNWAQKRYHGFPQPVRLTPGCTRWRLADIEEWEAKRAQVAA